MDYRKTLAKRLLEIAKTPIAPSNYAGEDARYSAEYEALERELNKGLSLDDTGRIDWERICQLSETLLTTQTKDLRVAAWLTWGLYQCESFPGLSAGIGLIRRLCEDHWHEVHPAKARTRAAALGWLATRLEPLFSEDIALKDQLPLFRELADNLSGLEACLSRELGSDAPLLLPQCRRLKDMLQRAAQGQPEPGSVGAVVAQVKQAATQLIAPNATVESEKDAQKALKLQQDGARPLCAWWLKQKATDLRALRLSRTLLWLPIDSLPERNAEQITDLRSPPQEKLKSLHDRYEQGQYADLLVELEATLSRAPFWLDGQRLAWECLQSLQADTAMREVEIQLALFVQRLPGVINLRFHGGAPFADPATRAWINAHVLPHLQSPANVREAPKRETHAAWEAALQDALPILRKDGLKPAVQSLKPGLHAAQGGRQRFFWQLGMARLCLEAKKYELAKTQLEALDQELHDAGLHAWEPRRRTGALRPHEGAPAGAGVLGGRQAG